MFLVAHQHGLAEVGVEEDVGDFGGVLSGGVAAGAEAVAEVVVDESGLDGVQVDDAGALAGGVVDHDVGGLGVAVDGAQEEFAALLGVFEDGDVVAVSVDELEDVSGDTFKISVEAGQTCWFVFEN